MNSLLSRPRFKKLSSAKIRIIIAVTVSLSLAVAAFIINRSEGINGYYIKPLEYSIILTFLGLILPLPKNKILKFIEAALIIFLLVKITYVELEMFNGNNLDLPFDGEAMMIKRLYINWTIIAVFYLAIIALSKNLNKGLLIGTIFFFVLGVISYVIYEFRGDTFLPADILALGTAIDVSESYHLTLHSNFFTAFVLFITQLSLLWRTKENVYIPDKFRLVLRICALGLVAYSIFIFNVKPFEQYYYAWFVPNNGYMFSVVMNIKMAIVKPDESYSEEEVVKNIENADGARLLKKSYNPTRAIHKAFPDYQSDFPNIVCIMNESFADLSRMGPIQTSEEVMPNIKAMKDKTVQGHTVVEVFGGGTSDSEYSFLTGNSTKLFTDNARAYEVYVKGRKNALPWNLKTQGYTTYAVHPDKKENWNRNRIYPLLGFDEFYSLESFQGAELVRDIYTSDRATYQKIQDIYENKGDDPMFVFDVTLQNHGSYNMPDVNLSELSLMSPDGKIYPQAQQYLSLIRKSDAEFQELINYFSQVNEPVLVLMFGDHYPKLDNGFYEALTGKTRDQWDLHTLRNQYSTPFVIWANYRLPHEQIDAISINYLSTLITELTGAGRAPYHDYLASLSKEFPVIDRKGVVNKKGEELYYSDLDKKESALITEYDNYIYNSVFTDSFSANIYHTKLKE